MSLETVSIFIAAITGTIAAVGSVVAAVTALLSRRERYELPVILARVIGYDSQSHDAEIVSRKVALEQPTEPPVWLLYKVRLKKGRDKWLAEIGDGVSNDYGEVVAYRRKSDWTHSIVVNPPASNGEFLLHPSASAHLWLSVSVVLRGKPRTKRSVVVSSE